MSKFDINRKKLNRKWRSNNNPIGKQMPLRTHKDIRVSVLTDISKDTIILYYAVMV